MFAEEVTLSTSDRQQCVCLVTALLIRQRGTGSGAARPCFRLLESLGASSPDEFIYVAASRGPDTSAVCATACVLQRHRFPGWSELHETLDLFVTRSSVRGSSLFRSNQFVS